MNPFSFFQELSRKIVPKRDQVVTDPCPICDKETGIHFYEVSLLSNVRRNKGIERTKSSWNKFGWWHWHEYGQHGISIQFFKWLWIITLNNEVESIKVIE